jgi:hypothetical protein
MPELLWMDAAILATTIIESAVTYALQVLRSEYRAKTGMR